MFFVCVDAKAVSKPIETVWYSCQWEEFRNAHSFGSRAMRVQFLKQGVTNATNLETKPTTALYWNQTEYKRAADKSDTLAAQLGLPFPGRPVLAHWLANSTEAQSKHYYQMSPTLAKITQSPNDPLATQTQVEYNPMAFGQFYSTHSEISQKAELNCSSRIYRPRFSSSYSYLSYRKTVCTPAFDILNDPGTVLFDFELTDRFDTLGRKYGVSNILKMSADSPDVEKTRVTLSCLREAEKKF